MKNPTKSLSDDLIRIPYFDWDKAKYFYFVVKLGGVTNAAKFLNIAQSAVSRKIQNLEDRLNFKLFVRTPTGLIITRKGEELYAIVKRTFLELKGLSYNAAVTLNNGQKRKIRIATTHAMASYIFSELLIEYNNDHPEISFELIGEDHLLDIILNDVDIAIRPIDSRIKNVQNEKGVIQEYLFSLEKRLYASTGYLIKYGAPQSLSELKDYHIVAHALPEKHPYSDVNWTLTLGMPKGELHTPIFTSNCIECLIEATKKNMGIYGSYEEFRIVKDSGLINILPAVRDKKINQYFIYPAYLEKDKDIQGIKNFLHNKLAKSQIKES